MVIFSAGGTEKHSLAGPGVLEGNEGGGAERTEARGRRPLTSGGGCRKFIFFKGGLMTVVVYKRKRTQISGSLKFGNGPNTVSESRVSNTELSEFCGPHRVPGRELSEFLSAYYLCVKANSPSFSAELTEFAAELSEFSLLKSYSPKQYSARFPEIGPRTRAKADKRGQT